jgi:hypothetical protein
MKWIDLRNNQLTSIPSDGLARHNFLRYILLGGNHIRQLPVELGTIVARQSCFNTLVCRTGKLKGLSALNLDGNPLDHPLIDVVKQGIKAIQQYLRDEYARCSNGDHLQQTDSDNDESSDKEHNGMVADVWASSDDEQHRQARSTRSYNLIFLSCSSLIPLTTDTYFVRYVSP